MDIRFDGHPFNNNVEILFFLHVFLSKFYSIRNACPGSCPAIVTKAK